MASEKPITGFGPLDAVDVEQDDVLVIVDVHDTSQSSSGSTKQVTLASMFAFWATQAFPFLAVTGLATLGKIKGGGSSPAVAPGGQAGTGATTAVTGTDIAGKITIHIGTGPAPGAVAVLTFNGPYATTPFAQLTAGAGGNALGWAIAALSTTGFTIVTSSGTPTASGTYEIFYQVTA